MSSITSDAAGSVFSGTLDKLHIRQDRHDHADPDAPENRDSVTISEEARKLAQGGVQLDELGKDSGSASSQKSKSDKDAGKGLIEERIEQLREEIEEIEESALSEKEKERQIQPKRDEIAELSELLAKQKGLGKPGPIGGTPAGEDTITGKKSLT